jgi:hypothetical protein
MARILLDFDATVVKGPYPLINNPVPGAIETLLLLQEKHDIILNTYRANISPESLAEAVEYLTKRGIHLSYVLPAKKDPPDFLVSNVAKMASILKISMDIYIDDQARFIPLISDGMKREYVDWERVKNIFIKEGLL